MTLAFILVLAGVTRFGLNTNNSITGALLQNDIMQFRVQSPYAQMQPDGSITIPPGTGVQLDWSSTQGNSNTTNAGYDCYLFPSRSVDGLTPEVTTSNVEVYQQQNAIDAMQSLYGVRTVDSITAPLSFTLKCFNRTGFTAVSQQTIQINPSSAVSTEVVQPYAHRTILYPPLLAPFNFSATAGSSTSGADGVLDVKAGSDVVLTWSSNGTQVQDVCSLTLSEPIPNPIVPTSSIHPALAQNAGAGGLYWGMRGNGTMTLPSLQKSFTVSLTCYTQIPPQGGTAYDFTVYRTVYVQPQAQCKDGADNDADGTADFPQDLDCANADDNSEQTIQSTYSCNAAQFNATSGTFQAQGWQAFNNGIGINSPAVDAGETYIRLSKDTNSTQPAGVYLPILKNQLQDKNWAMEMRARIRGSTTNAAVPTNMFFVAPDGRYTGVNLDTSAFGPIKTDQTYVQSVNRNTADGFHVYRIEYHENGGGVSDDSFDVIFDGMKVMRDVRIADTSSATDYSSIVIGQIAPVGAGSMDVSYVKFWNNEGQSTCGVGPVLSSASSQSSSASSISSSATIVSSSSSALSTQSSSVVSSSRSSSSALSSVSSSASVSSFVAVTSCGNGIANNGEACDDGNLLNGDGCTSQCTVEAQWNCPLFGQPCTAVCGDGVKKGQEECDDGNTASNDGCSSMCKVEVGWSCFGPVCSTVCGDSRVVGSERCDDGNVTNNDGCSNLCMIEADWSCPGSPSVCSRVGTTSSFAVQHAAAFPSESSVSQAPQQFPSSSPVVAVPAASSVSSIPLVTAQPSSQAIYQAAPVSSYTALNLPPPSSASSSSFGFYLPLLPNYLVLSSTSSVSTPPSIVPPPQYNSSVAVAPSIPFSSARTVTLNIAPTITQFASSSVLPSLAPPQCGNGVLEVSESCDRGSANSNTPGALCRTNCTLAQCGDGIVDAPFEECDEGNRNGNQPGTTCSSMCKIPPKSDTLAANIFNLPVAVNTQPQQQVAQLPVYQQPQYQQQYPVALNPLTATLPSHAPVGATGPGSLAFMAAGAAAGIGYVRRKK